MLINHQSIVKEISYLGVTEHPIDEDTRVVVLINYSPDRMKARFTLSSSWQIDSVWHGEVPDQKQGQLSCDIPANDAVVATIKRVS